MIEIWRLIGASTEGTILDINRLLSVLSPSPDKKPLSAKDMEDILADPNMYLFIAVDPTLKSNRTVGMATIFLHRNTARWVSEIHNVVTDAHIRGQGIGQQLVERLLVEAQAHANRYKTSLKVDLTSKPDRVAANNLYIKLGFMLIATATENGTNLYRKIIVPT